MRPPAHRVPKPVVRGASVAGVLAVGGAIVSQSLSSAPSQAADQALGEPVTLAPVAVDQATLQVTSLSVPDIVHEVQALAKGTQIAEDLARAEAERQAAIDASCDSSGFGGVKPHVAQVGHYLSTMFGIDDVGGVASRPGNPTSDHPSGYALDFMVDKKTGDILNEFILAHSEALGVTYTMWQVAAHYDHVHVSFSRDPDVDLPCPAAD